MTAEIDSTFLLRTLQELVRIESVNPSLVSGGAGESEIAAYLSDVLQKIGLEVSTYEPEPGRTSVCGTLQGRGAGRSLMLNAHTDTVGVEGMGEPFSGALRKGRVYGRGAYDMKGSLAACVAAAHALSRSKKPLRGDLVVAAVADEEYASLGMAEVLRHLQVDGAIVTEPTELAICLAHKGFIWLQVETTGRAAHGSRYDLGIDANMKMGRVLGLLEGLEEELRKRRGHPLLGSPSLHAARIEGGTELSAYAARCLLQIERRTVPGENEQQVVDEIQGLLDRLHTADPSFQARLETLLVRDPFETPQNSLLVGHLTSASREVLGRTPPFEGQNPWMDAALLSAAGVDTVVMGPRGAGAHAHEEWVDLASVEQLAQVLLRTAVRYCG